MNTFRVSLWTVLVAVCFCASSFGVYTGQQTASDSEMEVAGIIVKAKGGTALRIGKDAGGNILTGRPQVDQLNAKWGVKRWDHVVEAARFDNSHPFASYFVVEAAGHPDYAQMKEEYEQLDVFDAVELDLVYELAQAPNDLLFPTQVNLYNTGQLHPIVVRVSGDYNDYVDWVSGFPGADINAYDVLSAPPDDTKTVVVAIVDSGVDLDHPDLENRIWTNPRETAANGVDDDHNGYIDDVVGWDFSGASSDNDPTDQMGHGSHCAGIVAAVTNNSIGVAGICPDVKVMALRTSLRTSDNVAAIVYATDNGADVISMSWGGYWIAFQVALGEALNYAKAKGVTMCASAGNDGIEWDVYPSCSPATISVGASTDQDRVADFSTYSLCLDVVAPGVDIISLRADDLDPYARYYEPYVHIIADDYYIMSGTSMAGPTAAGVAAYVIALSPGLDPDKCKDVLCQTAHDILDPYGDGRNLPGWDKYSGWGRVDLGQAVQAAPSMTAAIASPWHNEILEGSSVTITGTASGDGFESYTLEYGEGWNPSSWTEIETSSSPVTDGTLGVWSIGSLLGHYTLRLRIGDSHLDVVTVFIGSAATAEIVLPTEGGEIGMLTDVVGSVYGADLEYWVLDYRSSTGGEWTELASSGQPADKELLCTWWSEWLATGSYVIRLSMYSASGLEASDEVTVYKTDALQPDWQMDFGAHVAVAPNYGDFDGDGQQEIVIGTDYCIMVLNPDGTIKTQGMPQFPVGDFRAIVSVGNLDGDGIDDMVALRFDTSGVYGFTSSGGDFVIPVSHSLLYRFTPLLRMFRYYVILSDTDGDGIDEIYVRTCYDYTNELYCIIPLEVGDEAVGQIWYGLTDFQPADLNNDGTMELYGFNLPANEIQQFSADGSVINRYAPAEGTIAPAFRCIGMSAYDIDGDNKLELIVSGSLYQDDAASETVAYNLPDVMIYAFDEGLSLKDGWPIHTGVSPTNFPSHPVFGDIDADGSLECFSSCMDIGESFIKGWHLDGTPYEFAYKSSLFIDSCWTAPPLLADINGDGQTDIVAASMLDFMYSDGTRLNAWDNTGTWIDGFPIMFYGLAEKSSDFSEPIIGDVDGDGNVDMTVPVLRSQLAHFEFDAAFDTCASPVTTWRYERSKSGVGPSFGSDCGKVLVCGDIDGDGTVDPMDLIELVDWFWNNGDPPADFEVADVNNDGQIDAMDVIYFVDWLWSGGPDLVCW